MQNVAEDDCVINLSLYLNLNGYVLIGLSNADFAARI